MLLVIRKILFDFKEYVILTILLLISLILLANNDNPQIKNLRSMALANFAVINSLSTNFTDLFSSDSEMMELKRKNAELMMEINRFREYAYQNYELRNLITLKDTTKYPLISAKIVSKLVSSTQGNMIVSVGSNDGIKIGMPVIHAAGLVGMVVEVTDRFSLVRTLQNSNFKLAVRDQRSNVEGILTWDGSDLIIKNIPTTNDVQIGDRVVTSDFSTIIPPSLSVGLIQKRVSVVSGLLSNIVVHPYVDFASINNVFVVNLVLDRQLEDIELNFFKAR
ncbi:MAG: rod shape-determining protein MreC [bacterium]